MLKRYRSWAALAVALALATAPTPGAVAAPDGDFADLSLEELMDVSIVSTARREVRLADTAAAVYVVTADDIRRWGCQSVPEALRLVPGVNVARIDAASWAVSIRGFNGRFADKLLVMIDGRSVYTPLFSGVLWENLDVVMEDVEQIEVVRGPGAAVWGANAVNGVINIITRSARGTRGGLAAAAGGSFETFTGVARAGAASGDDGAVRGFAKYRAIGAARAADGADLDDSADLVHGGFRLDYDDVHDGALSLQATLNTVTALQSDVVFTGLEPPYSMISKSDDRVTELAVVGSWERQDADDDGLRLQMFWDTTEIDYVANNARVSRLDLEVTGTRARNAHSLVWGGAYRLVDAGFRNTFSLAFAPEQQQIWGMSAFVNDDITLAPDRFVLTVGAKLEYNTLGDLAFQPNLRARWTPRHDLAVWASAARALRTPSIGSHTTRVTLDVLPPGSLAPGAPVAWVAYKGNEDVVAEDMVALEAGARLMPATWLACDVAIFNNDYDDLSSGAMQDPALAFLDGDPYLDVAVLAGNDFEARTWGGELTLDLRPVPWLRLRGAWSLLRSTSGITGAGDSVPDGQPDSAPENQLHAWLSVDATRSVSLEGAWRYVGELHDPDVPAYRELAARVAWKATPDLTVGLAGHNLLQERHLEFSQESLVVSTTAYIPRYLTADVRLEF